MQIIDVEQVDGNFYGGFPYRASWTFNGESEPSKLTIDVVNEQGSYGTPTLSMAGVENIQIGSFKFQGILSAYSLNGSAEQKTLTLEYVDKSIYLDQYWVGLKNIHGDEENEAPSNVILVGKEYHPCDVNMDSTIAYEEEQARQIDPCDPCPFSPVDKYREACDPRTVTIENYDVYYTFSDLIEKVKSTIPDLNIDYDGSVLYMFKAQHIGNLRNVLSTWCSDLGLSFFWDPIQSKLVLKSRNTFDEEPPVTYSSIISNPKATEINYREDLLGTFSQGFIGRFERQGQIQKYECQNDVWKMLRPITIDDLFLTEETPVSSKFQEDGMSGKSVAVALSYYSEFLRDLFLWFSYYGIMTVEDALSYVIEGDEEETEENEPQPPDEEPEEDDVDTTENPPNIPRSSSKNQNSGGVGNSYVANIESLDDTVFQYKVEGDCGTINDISSTDTKGNPKVLRQYGGMKIRKVFSIKSEDAGDKALFYQFRDNLPLELQEYWMRGGGTFEDPKYYFFIAEVSEEGHSSMVESDKNLANSFMGRFYFNKFRTLVTGALDDETECGVQGSPEDGGGEWHKAKRTSDNLEIFKFGHDINSFLWNVKERFKKDIEENEQTEKERIQNSNTEKKPEDFLANSYLLFSRSSPRWSPEREKADDWYASLYSWAADQIPHLYAVSDGRPDFLFEVYPQAAYNENIKLFIVKELDELGFEIQETEHQTEKRGGFKVRVEEDYDGSLFTINEGPWGLLSKKCYSISLGGMQIFMPPGSFLKELDNYEEECTTAPSYSLLEDELYVPVQTDYEGPGYRVFVNCRSVFPRIIPKFRFKTKIDAENTNLVKKVEYVDYQLQEDNVAIFGNSCNLNSEEMDKYLQDLGGTSKYSYSQPMFDISFKLAGAAPEIWNVSQGLSSMSIEVTENGVFTSYNMSTKIIQPPSISYIEQNMRSQKRSAFGNRIGTLLSVNAKTIRH
jgi:hypothetical protein